MSWIQLDDRILEHPKFVRAVRLGGSEAIHLWLGLRAYCAQFLSDGLVPTDMLPEVRGPLNERKREAALSALVDVGLLERCDVGVRLHDYLDWSSSRDEVLTRRGRDADRKRGGRSRTPNGVRADSAPPSEGNPNGVTHPRGKEREGEDLDRGSGSDPDARKDPFAAQFGESGSAFVKVYAEYPNKAGRSSASTAFAELALRHPGGPDGLAADVLAAFSTGMLRRKPYFDEKKGEGFWPFLDKFLTERRWEDDTNPVDSASVSPRLGDYPKFKEIPRGVAPPPRIRP